MQLSEFWELTPREFFAWVRGRFDSEYEQYKREAELQRMMTLIFVNTQLGKKQITDPKKLIKFAWEVTKPRKLTPEEVQKLRKW